MSPQGWMGLETARRALAEAVSPFTDTNGERCYKVTFMSEGEPFELLLDAGSVPMLGVVVTDYFKLFQADTSAGTPASAAEKPSSRS